MFSPFTVQVVFTWKEKISSAYSRLWPIKALKNGWGGIIKYRKHKFFCYDPLIMGGFCKFTVEARDAVKCKIKCNHLRMIEGGFL